MMNDIYRQFSDENCEITMSDEYFLHIDRMTREDLRSKSDIARELAWRDIQIKNLQFELLAQKQRMAR